jgi:hypothetical protein
MQKGKIVATNVSTSERDPTTGKVTHVRTVIKGRGDPGYLLASSNVIPLHVRDFVLTCVFKS